MKQDMRKLKWFFVVLGLIGVPLSTFLVISAPDDEPIGRLGIPAGIYAPILLGLSVISLAYGIYLVVRDRRRT